MFIKEVSILIMCKNRVNEKSKLSPILTYIIIFTELYHS